MKTGLFLSAAFIYLVGLFAASTGQAEIFECNSTTMVELFTSEECPDCPPPPDCPPVLACDEGYTAACVKDDIVIPPGEQQQYPVGNTEDFVQAITGGGLVDIALNDSRWGDREEGEVYARENEDFITWYWPTSGASTFDPTRLGNTAAWYDYRTASDVAGGGPHTSILLTAGMNIQFGDNGGGVSIFQRKDAVEPPDTGFLAPYTNPDQDKLPAHRVYPMGQKMMITAWGGVHHSRSPELKNAGFTMVGPDWNPSTDGQKDWETANKLGLRVAFRLAGGGTARDLLDNWMDNGAKEGQLRNMIKYSIRRAVDNATLNSQVDIWLTGTEELSTRMTKAGDVAKGTRYLKMTHDLVAEHDPQDRPVWMSDVTGVSKSSMMVTHRYLDVVGPQTYLDRCCVDTGYKTDNVVGAIAKKIKTTALQLDKTYPQRRSHPATMSHGLIYTPRSQARINNMKKIIPYWVFTAFNEGLQGMQVYSWYSHYTSISKEAQANGKAAYKAAVKLLTDNGLDYVYLWGDRRHDVKMTQLIGNEKTGGYPTISVANIQYGNYRYILITNGASESVTLTLTGIPALLTMTEMLTGSSRTTDNVVSLTIEPLGVRLYKVMQ